MRPLMKINCRNCGEGPQENVNSTEAVEWAMQHGKDAHENPYQGVHVSEPDKRTS